MYYKANENNLCRIFRGLPNAVALIQGDSENSRISGTVKFYQAVRGVLVSADIVGLPSSEDVCRRGIFGFHIHGGGECTGNSDDPFANAGVHYNPNDCPHPYHAGDMPPLFCAGGQAFMVFLTSSFTVSEIIGKTVIIHDSPDDFTTQPAGNAGRKIACGVISEVKK